MIVSLAAVLLAQASSNAVPAAPPVPAAAPCSNDEYRVFDFWVGRWDVYPAGSDEKAADSRIEVVSNGCAIRETWMPLRGGGGSSLTTLDPKSGTWNQLWIGARPGRVFFEGGMVDGSMVLTGYWGKDAEGRPQLVRMTYTRRADGSVRQHGQASSDNGLTWSESFDLIYRPHHD